MNGPFGAIEGAWQIFVSGGWVPVLLVVGPCALLWIVGALARYGDEQAERFRRERHRLITLLQRGEPPPVPPVPRPPDDYE